MFCPKCGKQLNDGDTFCAFCGETLNKSAAPQSFQPAPPAYSNEQQMYQEPAPVPNSTVQTKKSNTLLISVIAMTVCLVLIVGVVLFIKPGYLLERDDDDDSRRSKRDKSSSSVTAESDDPSAESSESKPKETTAAEPEATTTTTTSTTPATTSAPETTTTAPETTAEQTTTAKTSDDDTEKKNAVYEEAMSMSTYDRPGFDEFEWCFGQGGLVYEAPAGAEMITDPLGYTGGWKAMVIYNPTNSAGTFMRELDNIDIGVYDDSCIITIDWYQMQTDGSESYSEEDLEDTSFFGSVTDTGLYASGDAEISINSLWKQDGKQYALGAIVTSDGLPAYLAMVRP